MKVFVTGDLLWHSSTRGDRAVVEMSRWLKDEVRPEDVFLSLGNMAESPDDFREILSLFHGLHCRKLALCGNREIWTRTDTPSHEKKAAMAHIMGTMGFGHLEDEPFCVGSLGICGVMGWYDYSMRDDIEVPLSAYQNKTFPGHSLPSWNDALYAKWGISDEAVTQLQVERLERHLKALHSCHHILVGTHHLATRELLVGPRFLMPKVVRYANAFQGSQRFHQVLCAHPNVRWVFCGHIQHSKRVNVDHIRYASLGSTAERKEVLVLEGDRLTIRYFA